MGKERGNPEVARTFKANAVISLGVSIFLLIIYIWVRYGTVRWSLAATLPLLHDVVTLIGFLADELPPDHPFAGMRIGAPCEGVPEVWLLGHARERSSAGREPARERGPRSRARARLRDDPEAQERGSASVSIGCS